MASPYANTGIAPEEIADLDACDLAYARWWIDNKGLRWRFGVPAFALRIAFNAGWFFRSKRAASVDTLPKGQDAKQGLAGTEGGAVAATSGETPSLSSIPTREER